jgi:hypothetical protein
VTRLNQILAVEKGLKPRVNKEYTEIYRELQKAPLLSGITRVYEPKDEDGEPLPPESTSVQVTVADALRRVEGLLGNLWDVVATKETANTEARADVIVEDANGTEQTLLTQVPVGELLFLEKQLTELRQFLTELPLLDPAFKWEFDEARGVYATEPARNSKSAKVPRVLVKAEATDKHPAQTEVYHEDVVVGYWTTTKLSGALPRSDRDELVRRVQAVLDAVKKAREEANTMEVDEQRHARRILDFVLHGDLGAR